MKLEKINEFFAARVNGYNEYMLNNVEGCKLGYKKMKDLIPQNTANQIMMYLKVGFSKAEMVFREENTTIIIAFKGEEPSDVKDYLERFFFYKDGNEETILNNITTTKNATSGLQISSELGSISSKYLFYSDDLELIKESLNFLISGKLVNGENFEYDLILVIKKVY